MRINWIKIPPQDYNKYPKWSVVPSGYGNLTSDQINDYLRNNYWETLDTMDDYFKDNKHLFVEFHVNSAVMSKLGRLFYCETQENNK